MDKKSKRKLNLVHNILIIITVCVLFNCRSSCSGSTAGRTKIPFKGVATGGTLLVGDPQNPQFVEYVAINTVAGESAETVVERLAKAIASTDTHIEYSRMRPRQTVDEITSKMVSGNTLILPGPASLWCLSGTEKGLGIPEAPLFLSCSYDENTYKLEVKWENPASVSKNDIINIRWRYRLSDGKEVGGSRYIPGTSTGYAIYRPEDLEYLNMDVWLMVFRYDTPADILLEKGITTNDHAIPSNVAAIYVTNDGYTQQEIDGIPFSGGIAPNWAAWSTDAKVNKGKFEQYEKTQRFGQSGTHTIFTRKPFYQIINAPSKGNAHGIYRKFLGLTPGHTYRLTACMSTLEMDSVKSDWSFSIHAAPNVNKVKQLTAQQMAGKASLPEGQPGFNGTQIDLYNSKKMTNHDFALTITGDTKLENGLISPDITLPNDVNEIIVWLRFSCEDPKGKVAFSGVKLEDITARGSK